MLVDLQLTCRIPNGAMVRRGESCTATSARAQKEPASGGALAPSRGTTIQRILEILQTISFVLSADL